jgi:hypothetical protein
MNSAPAVGTAFRVTNRIRSGARFDVYDGERTANHAPVTIRVWNEQNTTTAFYRLEVAQAALRASPRAAVIFEISERAPGCPVIVSEHLAGEDLATRLARVGPQRPIEVAPLFVEYLSGLAETWDERLLHGGLDLESLYVVRGPDGREHAKILDFGLTKDSPRLNDEETTPTLLRALNHEIDVRAIGAALYECVTGRRPRDDEAKDDALGLHGDLSGQFPRIDPAFADILERAVSARSYPTARAFHFALTQWIQKERARESRPRDSIAVDRTPLSFKPPGVPSQGGGLPRPAPPIEPVRRSRAWILVPFVLVAIAAVLVVAIVRSRDRSVLPAASIVSAPLPEKEPAPATATAPSAPVLVATASAPSISPSATTAPTTHAKPLAVHRPPRAADPPPATAPDPPPTPSPPPPATAAATAPPAPVDTVQGRPIRTDL